METLTVQWKSHAEMENISLMHSLLTNAKMDHSSLTDSLMTNYDTCAVVIFLLSLKEYMLQVIIIRLGDFQKLSCVRGWKWARSKSSRRHAASVARPSLRQKFDAQIISYANRSYAKDPSTTLNILLLIYHKSACPIYASNQGDVLRLPHSTRSTAPTFVSFSLPFCVYHHFMTAHWLGTV